MLKRLQGLLEGKAEEFEEDMGIEDDDSNQYISIEQILKIWRISGFPELDEELTDFIKYMAVRESSSLRKVTYKKLAKMFFEGFQLDPCKHEKGFDVESFMQEMGEGDDNTDLSQLAGPLAESVLAISVDVSKLTKEQIEGNVDEALRKIVKSLSGDQLKQSFN